MLSQKSEVAWIDTHCHLDAPDFGALGHEFRTNAAINHVVHCVLPAVEVSNFDAVRRLAHAGGDSYALGIHPLYVDRASDDDLGQLDACLTQHRGDPRLVAVGEIGLDFFQPELSSISMRTRQEHYFLAQLRLARHHGLPVLLHSRRGVDSVLKCLRSVGDRRSPWHGIAHAFNGSLQQAQAFIDLGFKLGFGGALTYERAKHLRRLAATLPMQSLVLETDAPDMPPHWLYKTVQQRAAGALQGVNSPAELPRIAACLAELRSITQGELAYVTSCNALAALPKLQSLLGTAQDENRCFHVV